MKSVVFIGHDECYEATSEEVEKQILKCIKKGATHFYSGGQGGFDRLSARCVDRLKLTHRNIKNILVVPYPTFTVFDKECFDEIIFPDGFEKYHYKAAIPKRNRYMVERCDAAICFISHGWGNAVKTYEYAKRKGLEIMNLANYNES